MPNQTISFADFSSSVDTTLRENTSNDLANDIKGRFQSVYRAFSEIAHSAHLVSLPSDLIIEIVRQLGLTLGEAGRWEQAEKVTELEHHLLSNYGQPS